MILEKEYTKKVSVTHRKKFAQFFTPEPIARIMVDWLIKGEDFSSLLEPAFGLGIFSRLILQKKSNIKITGFDVDPIIFDTAQKNFRNHTNINIKLEDYLFNDWNTKYDRIICNPPYLKFHDYENSKTLNEIKKRLDFHLSGFTNIYTLFLLKSVYQLNNNGRISYIIPYEFLNSDYGKNVKEYLIKSDLLRHIFIFDFKKNIFDNALTTSAILLLSKDNNNKKVYFSTITNRKELDKIREVIKSYPKNTGQISIERTEIDPRIKWRVYYQQQQSEKFKNLVPFNRAAKVVRGIATGANDYFTFNIEKANKYNISEHSFIPCISKSKDVTKSFFTKKDFIKLKNENAKIFLFNGVKNPDNNVLKYIKIGEKQKIDKKYLTSKRNPWYSIENRPSSPIWVGVFNRNGLKFIRNEAEIKNLTTFHCIYPVNSLFNELNIDLLFAYLLTDVANRIFSDNRREYGGGLKKFEPNDLNNALMLDLSLLEKEEENLILNFYSKYRDSVIDNKTNSDYIYNINEMLIKKYT